MIKSYAQQQHQSYTQVKQWSNAQGTKIYCNVCNIQRTSLLLRQNAEQLQKKVVLDVSFKM